MPNQFNQLATSVLALAAMAGVARADQLAFTDFNDSAIGGQTNIKTSLNWVLNGLDDPGDLSAFNAANNPQTLADGNALMQDSFAPFVNTGNGNTFWTTTVGITPASGVNVTLTDISFTYVPFSSAQVLNVPRESDFIISLLDPSNNLIDSALVFATGGAGFNPETPTLTAIFTNPVELNLPGTYTLVIKGGDLFLDDDPVVGPPLGSRNETGNHTAIDNLSINGTLGGGVDPADLDQDGDVDDADFGIAFAAFTGPNNGPSNNPAADLDGDGDVDDADFGIAFAAFTGPGGGAGVAPEPASLVLLGLGGLAMVGRRRSRI